MFRVGSRFARLSFVSIVATAFLGGATMMPAFAQEKKLSKAEQVVLKHAIASCKSEAKAKKVKLLSRRERIDLATGAEHFPHVPPIHTDLMFLSYRCRP
jgi:hypothetical protein